MHNTESSWCNIWSRTNAQLPPAAPLLLSSSSTFCLLKRALILAALVHYYFFVFWMVRHYFLSFGTCSDLRRTMCTTFSPLSAKLCVFSPILAALVFYCRFSALLFYSAAASVKDCFSWVRQPFSVHWRQYIVLVLIPISTSSTPVKFQLEGPLLFFQIQSPFFYCICEPLFFSNKVWALSKCWIIHCWFVAVALKWINLHFLSELEEAHTWNKRHISL